MLSVSLLVCFFLQVFGAPAPAPVPAASDAAASSYWLSSITRQGTVAFGTSGYQIFRNVKDYGAKGDGITDDTAAISSAITAGSRCGQGCDSSTTTPALVYFPPGTYAISSPLIQLYYTQFVGDAVNVPTIKATAGFTGIALIDSDPYEDGGVNWYTNQVLVPCEYGVCELIVNRITSFAKFVTSSLILLLCLSVLVLAFTGRSLRRPACKTSFST